MLQKNAFGQKKFEFHAQVQKCHFGKIEKLPGKNVRENLNFTNFLYGDMNNPDELLNPLCLYGKLVGVCLRVIFGMFWVRYGFVGLSFVG